MSGEQPIDKRDLYICYACGFKMAICRYEIKGFLGGPSSTLSRYACPNCDGKEPGRSKPR